MELTIKKLYKKYGKRRIQVYQGKKLFGDISECWHWIAINPVIRGDGPESDTFITNHNILRAIAMENLWWLLHTDELDEDVTEQEAWEAKIDNWDKGIVTGPVSPNWYSLFISEEEKNIALNSINNK